MPRLKVLSGKDVLKIFGKFGFFPARQKGSHVTVKRIFRGENQTLTVPLHKELDKGTLKAIYRQASRYISVDELFKDFFI